MAMNLLVDCGICIAFLVSLAHGLRFGLVNSVLVGLGIVLGLSGAFLLRFTLFETIWGPPLCALITSATSIGLVLLAVTIGHLVCKKISLTKVNGRLRLVDRLAGGIALPLLVLTIFSTMSHSVGEYGESGVSLAVAGSATIQTLNDLTPRAAQENLYQVLFLLPGQRAPALTEGFGGINLAMPDFASEDAAFSAASKSVVRITGNAYACGQGLTGTGFVVAKDRIVTNAHVVAGVTRPVIEAPNGQVLVGEVVYFDSRDDIAVIAVTGLDARSLSHGSAAQTGERAEIVGYPHGGPITITSASVESVKLVNSPNIYREGGSAREVYILGGNADHGVSGAPVLNLKGDYVGIVFGRNSNQTNMVYAMTPTALQIAVDRAPTISAPVSSGPCVNN
jgi:S1-C subfamily serine protease